jgi:hypothetical protein
VLLDRHDRLANVVAETVGLRLEESEAFDLGFVLRRVGAARRERRLHVDATGLRRFLHRSVATQHDQVSHRHFLGRC